MIAESPEPIASGTPLGHYVVRGRLGAGGMGEVYEAHDSHLNRSVALKVVRQTWRTTPSAANGSSARPSASRAAP